MSRVMFVNKSLWCTTHKTLFSLLLQETGNVISVVPLTEPLSPNLLLIIFL